MYTPLLDRNYLWYHAPQGHQGMSASGDPSRKAPSFLWDCLPDFVRRMEGQLWAPLMCRQCKLEDIDHLTANLVKKKSEYFRAPDNEQWRLRLVPELLQLRSENMKLQGFTSNEIEDMIHFTCTSWFTWQVFLWILQFSPAQPISLYTYCTCTNIVYE